MPDDNELPEPLTADIETLGAEGFDIKVERTPNTAHVIFQDFGLPDKFNREFTDILVNVRAPRLYPQGGIDMFWTEEDIRLKNGEIPEKANLTKQFVGREWRRFSYHRGDINDPDWDPAYNDLVDHVSFIEQRLWELD